MDKLLILPLKLVAFNCPVLGLNVRFEFFLAPSVLVVLSAVTLNNTS